MSSWEDSKRQLVFQWHNLEPDTQNNTCRSKYILLWNFCCCKPFQLWAKAALDTTRLLNIDLAIYMTKYCGSINKKVKHQSIYKTLPPEKKRQTILRHSSKKYNDKVVEQEGSSYEAKEFWIICFVFELPYIHHFHSPLPPVLKKGKQLPKFSSPDGWEIICYKGRGKSEKVFCIEMGRLTVFLLFQQ